MHHRPSLYKMRYAPPWWMLGVLLVLTACGGSSSDGRGATGAATVPHHVEDVHAALLAALRGNDRVQVMELTVEDQQAARADTWLRMVQSYMSSTTTDGPYATGGQLSRVEVVRLEDHGAATWGWSRWVYARKTICHVAEFAETAQGWRVTSFHTTACTAGS